MIKMLFVNFHTRYELNQRHFAKCGKKGVVKTSYDMNIHIKITSKLYYMTVIRYPSKPG